MRTSRILESSSFGIIAIHGDLSQKERNFTIRRFRKGLDI
ncbi:MAG: hypothetical protein M3250_03180 [Thermoproteota archaeon]|jgi:superfamily II DNA/RNA helicase|nr:hypothetical protein [Thermoproteota archaeon]